MIARRFGSLLIALFTCLALAATARAELTAFMRVKGSKQGDIRGSVTQKGREDTIAVVALDHEITTPIDATTGLATGKRQHKPFVITKELDKSSVPLRNALITNEALPEVTLQFYAPNRAGVEGVYLTVTLQNARVSSIHHVMADNRDPEGQRLKAYEEITFSYETITWNWQDGGATASDSFGGRAK